MKKTIWGTGIYASQFAYVLKKENIDFFIDNDKKKSGQYFLEKKILSPDEIKNWEELYIYIPYNFYDEIIKQLQSYGAGERKHYEKYFDTNAICKKDFEDDYENSLKMINLQEKHMRNYGLFWGRGWALSNRGFKEFLLEWKRKDKNLKLGLVSEAIWYSYEKTEEIMKMPSVVTPGIFDLSIYVKDGVLTEEQRKFLKNKDYADSGKECLNAQFPEMKQENAEYMVYYMYQYVIKILETLNPKFIISHPLFTVQHLILQELCQLKGIPLISTHQGVLPGTLSFDIDGEMGKSLPSVYSKEFTELPVDKNELEYAERVWNYLYKSRLNRKIQPKNNCMEYVLKHINRDKPTVFFAGQNDILSDMVPYREETKKYHSPIFRSSIEAGIYIAKLCKRRKWNYIYKPHPMCVRLEKKEDFPGNTIYIESGDINDLIDISDVVVTILSQTNYITMIRHKPVVMLGFNQSKGKGCTYEAFEKNKIEDAIQRAIRDGFTEDQRQAFLVHIAQLIKYYLYDDLQEREIRFGRRVTGGVERFYELGKLLKDLSLKNCEII
ncbi:hypothetical protein D3Z53_11745 [Lachnospiraceae bacterium]|nr:hypothetical protein [uncultured Schaedlerella sp.]NBI58714.1 hypothetical protein [Lachnospiraceae bacterium]